MALERLDESLTTIEVNGAEQLQTAQSSDSTYNVSVSTNTSLNKDGSFTVVHGMESNARNIYWSISGTFPPDSVLANNTAYFDIYADDQADAYGHHNGSDVNGSVTISGGDSWEVGGGSDDTVNTYMRDHHAYVKYDIHTNFSADASISVDGVQQ